MANCVNESVRVRQLLGKLHRLGRSLRRLVNVSEVPQEPSLDSTVLKLQCPDQIGVSQHDAPNYTVSVLA